MAFIHESWCHKCTKTTTHNGLHCEECARRAEKQAREDADYDWQRLTVDGKLNWLRAQILALQKSRYHTSNSSGPDRLG